MNPVTSARKVFTQSTFLSMLLSILFAVSVNYAQEPIPESFFPHHLGDTWVYYVQNGVGDDTLLVRITSDSAGADGWHYVRTWRHELTPAEPAPSNYAWYDNYRLDTLGHVYTTRVQTKPYGVLYYDLAAPLGTAWATDSIGGSDVYVAKVKEYYPTLVWGQQTVVKTTAFYYTSDFNDTTVWLSEFGDRLATGFGLVLRGGGDIGYQLYLMAASIGGAVYGDTALLQTVSVNESASRQLPAQISLAQNYPNPFNPVTSIRFSIALESPITLKVFDLLGREVMTLISEKMTPGDYERAFDASRLASGVYLYRLQAIDFVQTKKLLLLR